jgi:hypothetical protein
MSIRALALDLYRARQAVDRLEKAHENASQDEKTALGQELKMAQEELAMLRRMLDGEKESGSFRKRFQGFGSSKR